MCIMKIINGFAAWSIDSNRVVRQWQTWLRIHQYQIECRIGEKGMQIVIVGVGRAQEGKAAIRSGGTRYKQ